MASNPCPNSEAYYTHLDIRDADRTVFVLKVHANGIATLYLGESHPLVALMDVHSPIEIQFSSIATDSLKGIHGKFSHGMATLHPPCQLASVRLSDNKEYSIRIPIRSKLIELNTHLLDQPTLLRSNRDDNGFLCIFKPKVDDLHNFKLCLPITRARNKTITCPVIQAMSDELAQWAASAIIIDLQEYDCKV